jgi:hypothetical protein
MAFHEQVRSGDTAIVGQRELDGFVERPSSVAAAHTERVRAAECAEIVALDVFNRPDRQPVTMSMVQAPGRRTTSASAVVPKTVTVTYSLRDHRPRRHLHPHLR